MFRSISQLISALCSQTLFFSLAPNRSKQNSQGQGEISLFTLQKVRLAHINCAYCEPQTRSLLSDLHTNIKISQMPQIFNSVL